MLVLHGNLNAQLSVRDSVVSISMVSFTAGAQIPMADLGDRFGANGSAGFAYHFKTNNNLLFGLEGNFLFGSNVKNSDSLAADIRTEDGFFIDNNGAFASVLIQERGLDIRLVAGRIIPSFGPNPNCGILIKVGAGLLQHRIRFEARENEVPQIEGDPQKGYDRLTNGLSLSQFIGYQHFGDSKLINFYAGFELIEAFTQSRRDFNFDLMMKDDSKRFDMLIGIKAGWVLPIYKRVADKYYIN